MNDSVVCSVIDVALSILIERKRRFLTVDFLLLYKVENYLLYLYVSKLVSTGTYEI